MWCLSAIAQGYQNYHLEPLLTAIAEIGKYKSIPQEEDLLSKTVGAYNLIPPEDELLNEIAQDRGLTKSLAASRFTQNWSKIQKNFQSLHQLL